MEEFDNPSYSHNSLTDPELSIVSIVTHCSQRCDERLARAVSTPVGTTFKTPGTRGILIRKTPRHERVRSDHVVSSERDVEDSEVRFGVQVTLTLESD